ncbi:RimK family alpha-L-glutamate ligase, partial [Mesorhizobium sp. M7A.F.Ca.AU.001.01.1.1]
MIPRILIVSDKVDTGSNGLAAGLGRGGAAVTAVPLAAIAFDTSSPSGLAIPGFGGTLPDAVLVRSIAAGSFEAVTRRLGVLHALSRLSVPVWNSAQAIERCVDKSMTTFLLKNAGLPTPRTFAVEGLAVAEEVAAQELPRGPLVLKPLFGAQGRGIKLIRTFSDLP